MNCVGDKNRTGEKEWRKTSLKENSWVQRALRDLFLLRSVIPLGFCFALFEENFWHVWTLPANWAPNSFQADLHPRTTKFSYRNLDACPKVSKKQMVRLQWFTMLGTSKKTEHPPSLKMLIFCLLFRQFELNLWERPWCSGSNHMHRRIALS